METKREVESIKTDVKTNIDGSIVTVRRGKTKDEQQSTKDLEFTHSAKKEGETVK